MKSEMKICPQCAKEILAEALVCPHCQARFALAVQGYCTHCHKVVEADDGSNCPVCRSELIDRRAVSSLLGQAAQPAQPAQAAAPGPLAWTAESTTVTLRLQSTYAMPPLCVACGQPAGSATLRASGSSSAGRQRLNLQFPLCQECARAHRLGRQNQALGCLSGLLVGLLLALPVLLRVQEAPLYLLGIAFVLAVIAGLGIGGLAWRRESPAVREAYSQVGHAVALVFILGGVMITFANRDFARQFRSLNDAAVIGE